MVILMISTFALLCYCAFRVVFSLAEGSSKALNASSHKPITAHEAYSKSSNLESHSSEESLQAIYNIIRVESNRNTTQARIGLAKDPLLNEYVVDTLRDMGYKVVSCAQTNSTKVMWGDKSNEL